jgi:hypothetical protein
MAESAATAYSVFPTYLSMGLTMLLFNLDMNLYTMEYYAVRGGAFCLLGCVL